MTWTVKTIFMSASYVGGATARDNPLYLVSTPEAEVNGMEELMTREEKSEGNVSTELVPNSQPKKGRTRKIHKCDICVAIFTKKEHMTVHRRVHTGEKPFACDLCDSAFAQEGNLRLHKRVHTGDKPYKCEVCMVAFSYMSSLARHRRLHTGDRPYQCGMCDSTFSRKDHLITHISVHTGEKPYQCDVCQNAFSQTSSLRMHKKIHNCEKVSKQWWHFDLGFSEAKAIYCWTRKDFHGLDRFTTLKYIV